MSNLTYTDVPIDLIVNKLSKEKYDSLVNANLINDTEIYLVDEDNLDAAGGVISNVGTPISPSDAANKSYVDTQLSAKQDAPTDIVTMYGCGACVGSITSDSWTTAIGYQVSAIGSCGATAVGYKSYATAHSTAIGSNAIAKDSGTTIGIHSEATGSHSTATGYYAQATGSHSIATGYGAKATSEYSIATGSYAKTTGWSSIATGYYAQATDYSIAIGYNTKALNSESIAIGCHAKANNTDSLAIGANTQANGVGTIAIGSTYYCTFNPTIADANTPIVIGSGESVVSAAQIRVTKEGVMTVGGKEVGKSMLETWSGTTDSQTSETDLMIGAKQENGVYPRIHARNKDIHGVTGFSNESDKYTGQRYILDWDLAMSNDTSYLMGATKWTSNRFFSCGIAGSGTTGLCATYVQPLLPVNTDATTSRIFPYAIPCFENSPLHWKGHLTWDGGKQIYFPFDNIPTNTSATVAVYTNTTIAIGCGAQATGGMSIATGNSAQATNINSIATGYNAQATAMFSIATGNSAKASCHSSIATGNSAKATGNSSIAIGHFTQAMGCRSIATGHYAKAQDDYTIAIGASKSSSYSVSASTAVPIVIGSDDSSVSAAQITVTSAGILNVGGVEMAKKSDALITIKRWDD